MVTICHFVTRHVILPSLQFSCGSPLAHWLPICSFSSNTVPDGACGGGRGGRVKTLQTCIIEQVKSQLFGKENKVLGPVKKRRKQMCLLLARDDFSPLNPSVRYGISAGFRRSSPFLRFEPALTSRTAFKKQSQCVNGTFVIVCE